jgi:sugar lactone lactonase YvrE
MPMHSAVAIAARDTIGEAPVWDAAGRRLLWCDMERGVIHQARHDADGWREDRCWNLRRSVAAAIPRVHGGIIVAGGIEFLMMDEAGHLSSFARLDADPALVRLNDAKCDPRGRLWAGTLAFDFSAGGALYRVDPDGRVTLVIEGLGIANGMDWSPDGSIFYFTDSLAQRIDACDFDLAGGRLTRRRAFVQIAPGEGGPNGLTVDREGCVWVAVTGGGEVRRYSPAGELLARVCITTPGATSCAFGGDDTTELFITSLGRRMPDVALTIGLTEEQMNNDRPESGSLFVCRPGVSGRPATPFAA